MTIVDPMWLLAVGGGLSAAARAYLVYKNWKRHGLTYFTYGYLVASLLGSALLAIGLHLLDSHYAKGFAAGGVGLYSWMLYGRLRCLVRNKLRI